MVKSAPEKNRALLTGGNASRKGNVRPVCKNDNRMATPSTRADAGKQPRRIVAYIDGPMAAAFAEAAAENSRSVSGELRHLVRERLAQRERWRGK
jgi:hypothetical protein